MRQVFVACLRALRVPVLVALVVAIAGCDEPLAMSQASAAVPVVAGDAAAHGTDSASAAGICEAPPATVLAPVPASGDGGAARDVRVHYHRPAGDYGDWGLHVWQVDAAGQYLGDYPGVAWDAPLPRSGVDAYGAYFDIAAGAFTHPLAAGFGFIVHPPGQGGGSGRGPPVEFRRWRRLLAALWRCDGVSQQSARGNARP